MRRSDRFDQFVCPACHGELVPEDRFLDCVECGRRYPLDDHGFPHLLIAEGDKHRREPDQKEQRQGRPPSLG